MVIATTMQKHKIVYKNKEIEFNIIKTARRKTSEIVIKYDDVFIRTPFSKSIHDIETLVKGKAEWILTKKKENEGKKPEIVLPTYKNNTTLPYLGKNIGLKIVKDDTDYLEFLNDEFMVHIKKSSVKTTYEKWLFSTSPAIFNPQIEKYSALLNVKPNKILVKRLKSRWGSTTFKGTINLNVNLIKAPVDVIEYVVLHEMGHLIEKNHSERFWKLIQKYMYNYSEKAKWLKINGINIL
jgi:predicted metal-dependent hydrolase